jgi:hypothetical protein
MLLVDLCPFEGSTRWIRDTANRLVTEYGFGNLQLDQLGHKWYCCYNPSHHHHKPQEAYAQSLPAVLAEIRKTVREHNPKGIMVGEGVNEFTAQYCDTHWTWSQLDFPEPLLFSLPWTTYSQEIDSLEYGDVNRAFAYKMKLDLKIEGGDGSVADHPPFADHLRHLAALKMRVDDVYTFAYFRDEEGIKYSPRDSVVLAKVYENPSNGKRGVVIANTCAEEKSLKMMVERTSSSPEYILYRLDGTVERLGAEKQVSLELSGHDVQVLVL